MWHVYSLCSHCIASWLDRNTWTVAVSTCYLPVYYQQFLTAVAFRPWLEFIRAAVTRLTELANVRGLHGLPLYCIMKQTPVKNGSTIVVVLVQVQLFLGWGSVVVLFLGQSHKIWSGAKIGPRLPKIRKHKRTASWNVTLPWLLGQSVGRQKSSHLRVQA